MFFFAASLKYFFIDLPQKPGVSGQEETQLSMEELQAILHASLEDKVKCNEGG